VPAKLCARPPDRHQRLIATGPGPSVGVVKIPGTKARAALREARDTYRRHSGAEPAVPVVEDAPGPAARQLPVIAERGRDAVRRLRERRRSPTRRDDPDVVLDIPRVHVDEIDIKLDELKARVALEAHVLDLLRLDVGVEAEVRGVDLKIAGVEAEAQLKVRLENLTVIIDRVMDTIDANPQLLAGLADRLGEVGARAAGELARGVRRAA
jgi:hypothetical protein